VITYRPSPTAKPPVRGEVVALEFVPSNFRFVDLKTEPTPPTYVVEETGQATTPGPVVDARRTAMMEAIRQRVRKPAEGEKREMGFIEKSECNKQGMFFHIKVGSAVLRLAAPQSMFLGGYTPDIEHLQIGCAMKAIDVPVVFVYKPADGPEGKRRWVTWYLSSSCRRHLRWTDAQIFFLPRHLILYKSN
jgi:hypothetical protein